jgi:dCMP deaminase
MEHVKKREDYISWQDYFMKLAEITARRSKDPSTQVGACIVNGENKILSVGYNGLPNGMNDDTFNWSRENDYLDSKYPYVCHAEMNAIFNSNEIFNLKGGTLYTTLYPCNECSKLIVQSGIKKVVYLEHRYEGKPVYVASARILEECGIEVEQFKK